MSNVVIISGIRTPFCRAGGAFNTLSTADLLRTVLREICEQNELDGADIDEIVLATDEAITATHAARQVISRAGLQAVRSSHLVNQGLGSGLQGIASAFHAIQSGQSQVVIVAAAACADISASARRSASPANTMTGLRQRWSRDTESASSLAMDLPFSTPSEELGVFSDRLARRDDISRKSQDLFASRSHNSAARIAATVLQEEIVPVFISPEFEHMQASDDLIQHDLELPALAAQPTLYDQLYGTVTGGNSAPLADGAAAILLMHKAAARALGYEALGTIRGITFVNAHEQQQGLGAALASAAVLQKVGVTYAKVQLTDISEFSAALVLSNRNFFSNDAAIAAIFGRKHLLGSVDMARFNVNGGAIAMGYAGGAEGIRQTFALMKEMRHRRCATGLAAMCSGVDEGGALLLEI